jgi:hypothetical protein
MKIAAISAFLAVAALSACARNDKTATHEPVGTTTVTSAPLPLDTSANGELDHVAVRLEGPAEIASPTLTTIGTDRSVSRLSEAHVTVAPGGALQEVSLAFAKGESDEDVRFDVAMALLRDSYLVDHAADVDVQVTNGAVTLGGTAATSEARTAAERIVLRESGVAAVDNRMRVGPLPAR